MKTLYEYLTSLAVQIKVYQTQDGNFIASTAECAVTESTRAAALSSLNNLIERQLVHFAKEPEALIHFQSALLPPGILLLEKGNLKPVTIYDFILEKPLDEETEEYLVVELPDWDKIRIFGAGHREYIFLKALILFLHRGAEGHDDSDEWLRQFPSFTVHSPLLNVKGIGHDISSALTAFACNFDLEWRAVVDQGRDESVSTNKRDLFESIARVEEPF